jgi:hypothetical protein
MRTLILVCSVAHAKPERAYRTSQATGIDGVIYRVAAK